MEPTTLCDQTQKMQPFTNINTNGDTMSGRNHPGKPVPQPGKLLHKDNKRIRRYISTGTEETHVALAQNRYRSSNFYSYNMCHDITDNNNNDNSTITKGIQPAKTIGRQRRTICGWMCTNNINNNNNNDNNENNFTPVHPGRFLAYAERRESMFSKHANNVRRSQQKQKPLINDSKNQPMQHLFKFWNQMKTPKSRSFSNY